MTCALGVPGQERTVTLRQSQQREASGDGQIRARLVWQLPAAEVDGMLQRHRLMRVQPSLFSKVWGPMTALCSQGLANFAYLHHERSSREDRRRAIRMRSLAVAVSLLGLCLMPALARGGEGQPPNQSAQTGTAKILVAYYSRTGNTEHMARGVVEGVGRITGVSAVVKKVNDVTKGDLEAADGIVLGCPTYFANIPGEMKTIIDDWNWKLKVDFTDKIGGAFATAGGQVGGQEHVVVSLLLFMVHNRMIVAGPLYRNERTGSVWAEAGAAAITGPLDPGVGEGEFDGARRLGERVAALAKKLKLATAIAGRPDESGFVSLFDGNTL